jgi:uncharacterized membrane protein
MDYTRKFKGLKNTWHGVDGNFFVLKFIVEVLGLCIIVFRFILIVLICDFSLDQRRKESACEEGIGARGKEEKNVLPLLRSSMIIALIILIFVWMDAKAILTFLTSWCYNCLRLHFHLVNFLFLDDGFLCWC